MQELRIGANEAGQRLDKFLKKALPNAPMSLLFKQLRNKNITLNGKKSEGKELLKSGDVVQCFFSKETFDQFSGAYRHEEQTNSYVKAYEALGGTPLKSCVLGHKCIQNAKMQQ